MLAKIANSEDPDQTTSSEDMFSCILRSSLICDCAVCLGLLAGS